MASGPAGFKRWNRLPKHDKFIYQVAWASDGLHLQTACLDGSLRRWDLRGTDAEVKALPIPRTTTILDWSPDGILVAHTSGDKDVELRSMMTRNRHWVEECHRDRITAIAWSPDEQRLATASIDYTIRIWDVRTREPLTEIQYNAEVNCLAWSPDGEMIAAGGRDRYLRIWSARNGRSQARLAGHAKNITALAWSSNGEWIATGSDDRTINVWHTSRDHPITTFEGHTATINSLSFSHSNMLLASKAQDETTRIWTLKHWRLTTILPDKGGSYPKSGVAFNPRYNVLAAFNEGSHVVDIFQYDEATVHESKPEIPPYYYSNAKVVLVGDGSAGKTSLGRALMYEKFEPTVSTNGLNVWRFDEQYGERSGFGVTREILLWDLAGQENYRIVHQLYLNDVSLALLVFNSSGLEPLKSIYYWHRALQNVHVFNGEQNEERAASVKKLLVKARKDQGETHVSDEYLEDIADQIDFDGYYSTSALRDEGITELRDAIKTSINWEEVPEVVSTTFFREMREFLKQLMKDEPDLKLSTAYNLFQRFRESESSAKFMDLPDLRAQFETCIGFLEALGLMRRFKFGGLVLLQPELLDFYASAIINAAKQPDVDDFGCLSSERIWTGNFYIPEDKRLPNRQQETWLLLATVDDLLTHEVAMKDDNYLIFPSQFVEELRGPFKLAGRPEIEFHFKGPIANIYAVLIVRLTRSNTFKLQNISRHRVRFQDSNGAVCELSLKDEETGYGELCLYFDQKMDQLTKYHFELFVYKYLRDYALKNSLSRHRIHRCVQCDTQLGREAVQRRLEMKKTDMLCSVCETRNSLTDPPLPKEFLTELDRRLRQMDRTIDVQRRRDVAASVLKGKIETDNFDVFIAHDGANVPLIKALDGELRDRGIYPWLEKSQINLDEALAEIIPGVKSVVMCVGAGGLGDWKVGEVEHFIDECHRLGLPFIPVLLPGVTDVPQEMLFMEDLRWVYFFDDIHDESVLDHLMNGITGTTLF